MAKRSSANRILLVFAALFSMFFEVSAQEFSVLRSEDELTVKRRVSLENDMAEMFYDNYYNIAGIIDKSVYIYSDSSDLLVVHRFNKETLELEDRYELDMKISSKDEDPSTIAKAGCINGMFVLFAHTINSKTKKHTLYLQTFDKDFQSSEGWKEISSLKFKDKSEGAFYINYSPDNSKFLVTVIPDFAYNEISGLSFIILDNKFNIIAEQQVSEVKTGKGDKSEVLKALITDAGEVYHAVHLTDDDENSQVAVYYYDTKSMYEHQLELPESDKVSLSFTSDNSGKLHCAGHYINEEKQLGGAYYTVVDKANGPSAPILSDFQISLNVIGKPMDDMLETDDGLLDVKGKRFEVRSVSVKQDGSIVIISEDYERYVYVDKYYQEREMHYFRDVLYITLDSKGELKNYTFFRKAKNDNNAWDMGYYCVGFFKAKGEVFAIINNAKENYDPDNEDAHPSRIPMSNQGKVTVVNWLTSDGKKTEKIIMNRSEDDYMAQPDNVWVYNDSELYMIGAALNTCRLFRVDIK